MSTTIVIAITLPGLPAPHTARSKEDAYDSLENHTSYGPVAFGPNLTLLLLKTI